MDDKITITEKQLYDIISRAMVSVLKDDWLTPEEFTKKILEEYYLKANKDLNELLK